jgi:hypothetical protein
MSDVWLRLAIVAAVLGVAALVALMVRTSHRQHPSVIQVPLPPGVYLFTSATCADCRLVRETIVGALGPNGYTEIRWEEQPSWFEEVGVDAVPSTVVVAESGSAAVYPGNPDRALETLGP